MNQITQRRSNEPANNGHMAVTQMQGRENAEVLSMVAMAKRFPRDVIEAASKITNAFTRASLAERAAYEYVKGGTEVTGPSIRAAEAMAQMWGNLDFGFKEVSRGVSEKGIPYSDVVAFCWDMEAGNRQSLQFIIPHWRDTNQGGYLLTSERDIYELTANQAQRRKRACILALIPGDIVEEAMNQAAATLVARADTSPAAMQKMVESFADYGVKKHHIEKRIGKRLDAISPAQVMLFKRIYASLRDEMSTATEWFEMADGENGIAPAKKPMTKAEAAAAETTTKPAETAAEVGSEKATASPTGDVDQSTGEITGEVAQSEVATVKAAESVAKNPAPTKAVPAAGTSKPASEGERKWLLNKGKADPVRTRNALCNAGYTSVADIDADEFESFCQKCDPATLAGLTNAQFATTREALR